MVEDSGTLIGLGVQEDCMMLGQNNFHTYKVKVFTQKKGEYTHVSGAKERAENLTSEQHRHYEL